MNVDLSESSQRFIADQVASGVYPSEAAVLEDALARMKEQSASIHDPASGVDPLWGMFRDDPELIDRIVKDAMNDRRSVPLRTPGDE